MQNVQNKGLFQSLVFEVTENSTATELLLFIYFFFNYRKEGSKMKHLSLLIKKWILDK